MAAAPGFVPRVGMRVEVVGKGLIGEFFECVIIFVSVYFFDWNAARSLGSNFKIPFKCSKLFQMVHFYPSPPTPPPHTPLPQRNVGKNGLKRYRC